MINHRDASPPKFSIGDYQSHPMKSWEPARRKPCGLFCALNLSREVRRELIKSEPFRPLKDPTKSSIVFVGPKRMETPRGMKNQAVNRYGNQSRQT